MLAEVVEPGDPLDRIANDENRPPFTDDVDAAAHRALGGVQVAPCSHSRKRSHSFGGGQLSSHGRWAGAVLHAAVYTAELRSPAR